MDLRIRANTGYRGSCRQRTINICQDHSALLPNRLHDRRDQEGRCWMHSCARRVVVPVAVLLLVLIHLISPQATAQENGDPITIGTWRTFHSTLLAEPRQLNIGLPDDYEDSDATYPVLFLLDGPFHFHHTTGLTRFLAQQDVAPGMIVVAVGNTDRTRDMTPPTRDTENPMAQNAGGADNFIAFFRDELIPFIDSEYRTHPYRVLVGHSFGGLFAMHTFVHEPDVFDAYLAISPSLWWDDQMLVDQAEEFFETTDDLNKTLYITMGSEGGDMLGGLLKLEAVMTEQTPRGFEWSSRVMKEETHNSVPYRSTRQGLEYIFRHWGVKSPMSLYDQGGLDAVYGAFDRAEARYGMERAVPPGTFTQLAAELIQGGRLDDATEVLEHDPENLKPSAMIYTMLAEAHAARDDEEGMIAAYARALARNPTDDSVRERLAALGVDTNAIAPKPVPLSEEQLAAYVGSYRDDDQGDTITIALHEGELTLRGSSPSLTLKTLKTDHFIGDGRPIEVVFERDANGNVVRFNVLRGSRTVGSATRDRN